MMKPRSLLFAAMALACIGAGPVRAHEHWLEPSTFRAASGDTVTVGARVGEGFGGERRAFRAARAARWVVRGARELDLAPVSADGDSVWARVAAGDPGGLLFGYESDFARITLEAGIFERYLWEEGLDRPLATRRARGDSGPGRERYRRCAKAWVAGDSSRRALEPFAMPCEIVPLATPGASPRLRVRVVFEGRPLPDARINAWRRPSRRDGDAIGQAPVPLAWSGPTDANGEASVPLEAAGEWLLGVVHMIPSRDRRAADWESTWASLTFARAPGPQRAAAESRKGRID